jgi:hypothetical protein
MHQRLECMDFVEMVVRCAMVAKLWSWATGFAREVPAQRLWLRCEKGTVVRGVPLSRANADLAARDKLARRFPRQWGSLMIAIQIL